MNYKKCLVNELLTHIRYLVLAFTHMNAFFCVYEITNIRLFFTECELYMELYIVLHVTHFPLKFTLCISPELSLTVFISLSFLSRQDCIVQIKSMEIKKFLLKKFNLSTHFIIYSRNVQSVLFSILGSDCCTAMQNTVMGYCIMSSGLLYAVLAIELKLISMNNVKRALIYYAQSILLFRHLKHF